MNTSYSVDFMLKFVCARAVWDKLGRTPICPEATGRKNFNVWWEVSESNGVICVFSAAHRPRMPTSHMAPEVGFKPTTYRLEGGYSIR